jgi:hypothetical protein
MKKLLLLLALCSASAWAGPGHDHGDAAPAATGTALPRFTASSELFELVGVLDGRVLTVYLDRAASNEPVPAAQLELEVGSLKLQGQLQADGTLRLELPAALQPGVMPVTATVTAGDEVDLLAGELDLHADDPAHGTHTHSHTRAWVIGGAAALALLAAGFIAWRKRRSGVFA